MIPTKKDKQEKINYLIENDYELIFDCITYKTLIDIVDLQSIIYDYAKWYANEIIKHCAEVVTTKIDISTCGNYRYTNIDKQSILNVIKELEDKS